MFRKLVNLSMILALGLAFGCTPDKPAGTEPPAGDDAAAAAEDGKKGKKDKKDKKDKDGGEEVPAGEDPTKKVCDAQTSDAPYTFFDDKILVRTPFGVTDENLVEMSPGFARLSSMVDSVSCIEGVPGATINFMVLTMFEDDGSKPLEEWRKETVIDALGYPEGVTYSEEKVDGRKMTVVIDIPEADGKPPGKAYMILKGAHGRMHIMIMETHPNAWTALKNTFEASASKMSVLP